jgi:hypothetical protein
VQVALVARLVRLPDLGGRRCLLATQRLERGFGFAHGVDSRVEGREGLRLQGGEARPEEHLELAEVAPIPSAAMAASSPVTAVMSACRPVDQVSTLRASRRCESTRCSKCIGERT